MKKKFFLLVLLVFYSFYSTAQSIPKYLSPEGLVLFAPLKNKELLEYDSEKNYKGIWFGNLMDEKIFLATQSPNNSSTVGEWIKGVDNRSFDRELNLRKYFIPQIDLRSQKINFLKPITIGFWISSHKKMTSFNTYINDRLKIELNFNSSLPTLFLNIEQKIKDLYQKDVFQENFSGFDLKPLEYSISNPSDIKRKNEWYLIVLEFDINTFSISINGDLLKVYNLNFLKKSDFKEKYPKYDFKWHASGQTYQNGLTSVYCGAFYNSESSGINRGSDIDDLFIYERLLNNEEISSIAFSRLNPYYLKPIRDSIYNIKSSFDKIEKNSELTGILNFLNNDLSRYSKYVSGTDLNELKGYPKVVNRNLKLNGNPTLDSLFIVKQNIEYTINNKIDLLFAPLISNPTKEVILNTFNNYDQIDKKNIDTQFLNRFKDSFGKMVRQEFYNTLENKEAIPEDSFFKKHALLLAETKDLYKKVTNREFDLEYNLVNNPPKSSIIRYKSSTQDFVRNPTVILYEFNKDRKDLTNEKSYTVKWDEKQLNFIDYKLDGIQKFYNSERVVYEDQVKEGKLVYEKWYDYSESSASPKVFDKFYDSQVYYDKGRQKLDNKEYSLAILDFTQAIRINPMNSDYYFEKGAAESFLYFTVNFENNFIASAAMTDYDKAIELNTQNPKYYYFRGVLKSSLKDLDGGYQDLKQATDMGLIDEKNFIERVRKEKDQFEREYEQERKKGELAEAEKNKGVNEIRNILNNIVKTMVAGATGEWQKNPKNCYNCKGKGIVSVCPLCSKRGKIICKSCKGRKVLRDGTVCIQCYGTGIQKCDGCNGKVYNIKCLHTIWQFQK